MPRRTDLAVALVTTVMSILLFEGGARFVGLAPIGPGFSRSAEEGSTWSRPDPQLGWLNKEGIARAVEHGNAMMTFSADGSRFSPLLQSKEAAPVRVLVVGCSFTQGYGVADDQTYVHYLNERFPQIRFENFGTGGYNTLQSTTMAERVLAQRGPEERPDLVIYGLLSDHLRRNVSSANFIMSLIDSHGGHISPPHGRISGGELELRPYRAIEPWPLERSSVILALLHNVWMQARYDVKGSEAEAVTRKLVENFDRTVRALGSRPLVVLLKTDRPVELLVRPGSVELLDCSHPDFDRDPSLRVGGVGHPSAKLQRHYADCIGDWIGAQLEAARS